MVVGRFQVMAVLQAARAFELGLPLESALSWGLNRAIFYAAAKRGFKGKPESTAGATGVSVSREEERVTPYQLGNEFAFSEKRNGRVYFVIGGKPQTEKEFAKQIESRFGSAFKDAWDDALDYVRHFDSDTLKSGNDFFSSVYRPKRDEFAAKWSKMSESAIARPKNGTR